MTTDDRHELDTTLRLVDAAQGGDAGAIEDLFRSYLPRVRQIVALRLGWRLRQFVELDDVVQQVLLRVFRSLDGFERGSHGCFQNWLARCVEREIADQARTMTRQKRGGGKVRRFADCGSDVLRSSILVGSEPTPSEMARADEVAEALEAALLTMPQHQRELIILRSVCGMSHEEVARELNIANTGAVRVACFRALQRLKDLAGLS